MAGGTGTITDPYRIETKSELLNLQGIQSTGIAYFALINDIDFGGDTFAGVVSPRLAVTHFDGRNFKIKNLNIVNQLSGGTNVSISGFFSFNSESTISNLTFENVTGSFDSYSGSILYATGSNNSSNIAVTNVHIRNCSLTGSYVGSFFSNMNVSASRPVIKKCSVENSTFTGLVCGTFIGNGQHTIEDSYDKDCTLTCFGYASGMVANESSVTESFIRRCYSNSEYIFDHTSFSNKPTIIILFGTSDNFISTALIPKKVTVINGTTGNLNIFPYASSKIYTDAFYSTCEVVGV